MNSYRAKGIRYLYMTSQEFKEYISDCLLAGKTFVANKNISDPRIKNFLKHSGELILEQIHLEGVDEDKFCLAKDYIETTLEVLSRQDEAFGLLTLLNDHADYLYAHSLGVSMYAVMIAKAFSWSTEKMFYSIAMGGLFHDIGKKEIDPKILYTPNAALSIEERLELKTHAARGIDILNNFGGAPMEVKDMVYQHHEEISGTGYPQRLTENKISKFSRIISVANVFCNYAIKNPNCIEGMAPSQALREMMAHHSLKLDRACLTALKNLFHLSSPSQPITRSAHL